MKNPFPYSHRSRVHSGFRLAVVWRIAAVAATLILSHLSLAWIPMV